MADTGLINPTTQSGLVINGANAIDDDDDTFALPIDFAGNEMTFLFGSFNGTDPPAGSTINGIEVIVIANENPSYADMKYDIEIALDGTSGTFSSTGDTQDITTTKTTYTFGANNDLWGLNWSGWTDLSDLAVRIKQDNVSGGSGSHSSQLYELRAKVYYTEPAADQGNGKMLITSGKLTLSSGKILL